MAKIRKFFIVAACLLALGARPVSAAVDSHLAVRVEVFYAWEQGALLRQYTDQAKMRAVLNYLRLAQYAGMPEDDPLAQPGHTCRVRVHLADGRQHQYLLHAEQFLCRDGGAWEVVELQAPLLPLLRTLPSDE